MGRGCSAGGFGGQDAAVGGGDLEGGVREEFGVPARLVEQVMVTDTDQDQVARTFSVVPEPGSDLHPSSVE
jgi:hypothetical protein